MAETARREGRFYPLAAAVAARRDIGAAAKLTHAALSSYVAMGRATPGQGRLARELGLSLKTVSRAVRELQAAGLVSVTPGAAGGACAYKLTPVNLTTPVKMTHPPPVKSTYPPRSK
jgi:DNA-binding MarR family transcriptional regulator